MTKTEARYMQTATQRISRAATKAYRAAKAGIRLRDERRESEAEIRAALRGLLQQRAS